MASRNDHYKPFIQKLHKKTVSMFVPPNEKEIERKKKTIKWQICSEKKILQ